MEKTCNIIGAAVFVAVVVLAAWPLALPLLIAAVVAGGCMLLSLFPFW